MIIKDQHYDPAAYIVINFQENECAVDNLSMDELQQTVCQLIEYVEVLSDLNHQSKSLIEEWRYEAKIKSAEE